MNVVAFAFLIPSLSRVSFAHLQMGYVTYIPTRVVNTSPTCINLRISDYVETRSRPYYFIPFIHIALKRFLL